MIHLQFQLSFPSKEKHHMQNSTEEKRCAVGAIAIGMYQILHTDLNLIMRGLKSGWDELIKNTKTYLFEVPIVLLMLWNRIHGPSFSLMHNTFTTREQTTR